MMNLNLLMLDLRIKATSSISWFVCLVLIVSLYVCLFPSISHAPGVDQFLQQRPQGLREAFAIQDYSTPAGYLQTELFSGLVPVVVLVLVIGRGGAAIAGEEEVDRLEIVMAQPLSRNSLYFSKVASLLLTVFFAVFVAVFGTIALVGPLVSLHVSIAALLGMCVHLFVFAVLAAALALAGGAALGHKTAGIALAGAVFAIGFLVETIGRSVSWLAHVRPVSPWHWYSGSSPLLNGINWVDVGVLAGATVLTLGVGAWLFNRRDLLG